MQAKITIYFRKGQHRASGAVWLCIPSSAARSSRSSVFVASSLRIAVVGDRPVRIDKE